MRQMSHRSRNETYEPESTLNYQTLEITFRLLRNNNPLLAFLIKNALTDLKLKNRESNPRTFSDDIQNQDLLELLGTINVIQIVGNLNDIASDALAQKNMPPSHLKILRQLIEEWASVAEWILSHAALDKVAYH